MAQEQLVMGANRRFGSARPTATEAVSRRHAFRANQPYQPLPAPTGPYPYRLDLAQVVSAAAMETIVATGRMVFHMVGDTGGVKHPVPQQIVAMKMEDDFQRADGPAPSFLYILGDLIYFHGEASQYYPQFYEPYVAYPAPIFAIPGNHDGDPADASLASLAAYVDNFCAATPHLTPEAGDTQRDAMTQPNPYWTLLTPYATIIGIYSNVPEGGRLDDQQIAWLQEELAAAPADKALVLTMHHPALSADNLHGGSSYMGGVLDQAIQTSGRIPDLIAAGHVHNYQRFTRAINGRQTAYLVAGAGGYWHLHPIAGDTNGTPPPPPWSVPGMNATLDAYVDDRHGYLRVTASAQTLQVDYITVPRPQESWQHGPTVVADSFTVAL